MPTINVEILKFFADFIEKETGIQYSDQNFFQLENRLNQIAKQMGKPLEALYVTSHDKITGDFKRLLLDLATNNETSFFRDKALFKSFQSVLLPEVLAKKSPGAVLRIWSAAASTGQEAYSLAMTLDEMSSKKVLPPFKIECTDICEPVLEKAKSGLYSNLEVQRGLPTPNLLKYFKQVGDQWKISDSLIRNLTFNKLNLLADWNIVGEYDFIFCRNVLIYQKVENKKKVIAKLAKYLSPNGYLILGATESMFGISEEFETVLCEGATFYRKRKAQAVGVSKSG